MVDAADLEKAITPRTRAILVNTRQILRQRFSRKELNAIADFSVAR
ncbi:MAG: hypothetical protein R2861_05520 [Desulfobacterales bacterium]